MGMRAAFIHGDQVITSYRGRGHTLAAGMSPRSVMAELSRRPFANAANGK
ncbi:TPP-dependent pyruvate/acetoin dehydrogenase alpha subunit [Rhizobium sp. BK176]|nr:TPP-dependent pyruvate/acetoin dehydrogenase alpha subunit [Rhizobium sp. BK399]MCS3741280.1 TPP-dependent pyruvate/acetoin dehydrogenase alpha subunit [Rhizobium sp. BK661]MCS4093444.1 TPP-dependent pyruvate/acetoin dehydrogenase alpha subunit [Rhizobium sp. BK176]